MFEDSNKYCASAKGARLDLTAASNSVGKRIILHIELFDLF